MFVIIQTTVFNKKEAKTLSKILLEKKLVACVQITKVESNYVWKGEICKQKEYLLSFKSTKNNINDIERFLLGQHSYELPEITIFETSHSKEYGEWVQRSVK